MGKRHYIETPGNDEKTSLKEWARKHKHYFPYYDFSNSQRETPTTELIARKLIQLGYSATYSPRIVVYTHPQDTGKKANKTPQKND